MKAGKHIYKLMFISLTILFSFIVHDTKHP